MADARFVSDLLAQVHKDVKFHQVVEHPEDAAWTVMIDEHTEVHLEHDEASAKLYFFCELGTPPEKSRLAAYRFFLQYNYQVHQTGGGRIAMCEPDGPVSMIFDLTEAGLRAGALASAFHNLEAVLPVWRDLVAHEHEAPDESPEGSIHPHHSMRV
jgi:hypothetical protein